MIRAMAVVGIGAAALGLHRDQAQLRHRHAERDHDRDDDRRGGGDQWAQAHPDIWAANRLAVNLTSIDETTLEATKVHQIRAPSL